MLVDLPPTSPGAFFKPMYINYRGDASASVPTAAAVFANLNAEAKTLVLKDKDLPTVWEEFRALRPRQLQTLQQDCGRRQPSCAAPWLDPARMRALLAKPFLLQLE